MYSVAVLEVAMACLLCQLAIMRSESSSGHQVFQVKMICFGELSLISTYE